MVYTGEKLNHRRCSDRVSSGLALSIESLACFFSEAQVLFCFFLSLRNEGKLFLFGSSGHLGLCALDIGITFRYDAFELSGSGFTTVDESTANIFDRVITEFNNGFPGVNTHVTEFIGCGQGHVVQAGINQGYGIAECLSRASYEG